MKLTTICDTLSDVVGGHTVLEGYDHSAFVTVLLESLPHYDIILL